MSKAARFGPVQVEFREDGSLFIYQPSDSIVLGTTRAAQLVCWLAENFTGDPLFTAPGEVSPVTGATLPAGVINTSTGPALSQYARDFVEDMKDPEFAAAYEAELAETQASIERGVADGEAENVTRRDDVLDDTISDGVGGRVSEPKPAASPPSGTTPRRRGRPPKAKP
jgi:hypothetical protein